ncbi:1,4-alpha-glucan branching protein domain-containing protein [Metabacillus idriensis]|uniref:1,4-alpha-glucan branching protein domain-containing protein n=1 Tax=Metabacillus idriensis TaxID=324768 RepID=UPI003D2AE9A4
MMKNSMIILHAHLPFITDYTNKEYEQLWLFEALSESYIPVLWSLKAVENPSITISFSPTLMEMLTDKKIQANYRRHLDKMMSLIKSELSRGVDDEQAVLKFYHSHYEKMIGTFEEFEGNILKGYIDLFNRRKIEVITTCATHAILPFHCTEEGMNMQVETGMKVFEHHFGTAPKGFWLPEMAINAQTIQILAQQGIEYTFADSPEINSPAAAVHGVTIFKRNKEIAGAIWDKHNGYPAHHVYREYYRDVGFIRNWDDIKEFAFLEKTRINTGLKLWRITGQTERKKIYMEEKAFEQAKRDAQDFLQRLGSESELSVIPFDFELFGHWWFEGPVFLLELLKHDSQFILPSDWLKNKRKIRGHVDIAFSTWGKNGYGDMWLNEKTAEYFHHFHLIEKQLFGDTVNSREMNEEKKWRLIKEWMLAASSDWTFMIGNGTSADYGHNRIKKHLINYYKLSKSTDEPLVVNQPEPDIFAFLPLKRTAAEIKGSADGPKILMVSTEYPPNIVGGLGRHVDELSNALAGHNYEVVLLTVASDEKPFYENPVPNLHVYRIPSLQLKHKSLTEWIMNHNSAFVQFLLKNKHIEFDIVHVHDWLTGASGRALQNLFNVPLIATIHATELGRNKEIRTPLQKDIYWEENLLVHAADRVIVCSDYMLKEVTEQFHIPSEKLTVIPNGINLLKTNMYDKNSQKCKVISLTGQPYLFSMGRLVPEKGFDVLLSALPGILKRFPKIRMVIAGDGPHRTEYEKKAKELNVHENVTFLGFIDEDLIHILLTHCEMNIIPSYYEPFGIVALESMAAKKLTIAANTGGLREIINHTENGLLFERGNSKALASAILEALQHKELADRLAQKGYDDVLSRFAYEHIINKVINEYKVLYPKR